MSEIYSNQHLKITKNTNNIFRIEFKKPNPILILSIQKNIRGATCSHDYQLLTFKACSVEMFKQNKTKKPGIKMVANMVFSLSSQLKYMIDEYSYTFLGFNTENIMVIDGSKFLCLDIELMNEIDEQSTTTIFSPFKSTDFFFSPEFKKASKLPLTIHYKTVYFSLGCLLLYVLLSYDNAFYQEYLMNTEFDENMEQIFEKYLKNHPIKETKLYWLIIRCLVEEPEKRSILFI
jgi:hypothetical protein